MLRFLELRLDNVCYRAGWAATRPQARQFVGHGHVSVNGKRVTIPSYRVRKGDVITMRDKAREFVVLQWNREVLDRQPPAWLESGDDGYAVTVLDPPHREQIDVPVREQLIVELYSK
jgi:small subunit ribosomal protein S4